MESTTKKDIISFSVSDIRLRTNGKLLATFNVTMQPLGMVFVGCCLYESGPKTWWHLPRLRSQTKEGKLLHLDMVKFQRKDVYENLQKTVLRQLEQGGVLESRNAA